MLAGGLAALAFCARWLLQPVFGGDHAYTVFYPVVILSAYFLGARPAMMAAAISAAAAYFTFAAPAFSLKVGTSALLTLGFFGLTSMVSIYFITGMSRALRALEASQHRAETLAASHAALFSELNERVTNHLQLVAAVLQLQARDESDGAVAGALTEASARTLLISRTHRSLIEQEEPTLDFESFVRSLLEQTWAAKDRRRVDIDLDFSGVRLTPDQATSVAVVLLERLRGRFADGGPARVRISLREEADSLRLRVSEQDLDSPPAQAGKPLLVQAMVEQLCGQFIERFDAGGATSELTFPRTPGRTVEPVLATLH